MTNENTQDENNGSAKPPRPYAKTFTQPSLTKQSFRRDCEIQTIIQRYKATGEVPQSRPVRYGEQGRDFYAMNLQIAEANTQFEELSDEIKAKYGSIQGINDALKTAEGQAELAADGLIELVEPPTSPKEEKPDTGETTPNHELNLPPADPGEAGAETS